MKETPSLGHEGHNKITPFIIWLGWIHHSHIIRENIITGQYYSSVLQQYDNGDLLMVDIVAWLNANCAIAFNNIEQITYMETENK